MTVRLERVSKSYGDASVVSEVSATFPERGIVGVVGPSGSGKTTLLRIIAGLEAPDSGRVLGVPECVSMQFEDDRLFPWMNAAANVALVGGGEQRARDLLARLGLEGRGHARISELSGGQRRRFALARALAYDAPLCLLDEPTARLDAASSALALDEVARRAAEGLVILATHDPQAIELCGSVLDMTR